MFVGERAQGQLHGLAHVELLDDHRVLLVEPKLKIAIDDRLTIGDDHAGVVLFDDDVQIAGIVGGSRVGFGLEGGDLPGGDQGIALAAGEQGQGRDRQ